jgi:hypothetical protein
MAIGARHRLGVEQTGHLASPRNVAEPATHHRLARTVASGAALGMAGGMLQFSWPAMQLTPWIAAGVLALTALLVQTRSAGAQLIARGTWTSVLLLSALNALVGPAGERLLSFGLVGSALVALGAAGGRTLADAAPGPFAPRAHRFSLVAAMSLAFADAASLLFYGVAWVDARGAVTLPLLLGLLMLASLTGLYRLRGWGLVGSMAVAATTAIAAFTGTLAVPIAAQLVLAITASAQVVLLAPVLAAALRGTSVRERQDAGLSSPERLRIAGDQDGDRARIVPANATVEAEHEASAADEHRASVRHVRVASR